MTLAYHGAPGISSTGCVQPQDNKYPLEKAITLSNGKSTDCNLQFSAIEADYRPMYSGHHILICLGHVYLTGNCYKLLTYIQAKLDIYNVKYLYKKTFNTSAIKAKRYQWKDDIMTIYLVSKCLFYIQFPHHLRIKKSISYGNCVLMWSIMSLSNP